MLRSWIRAKTASHRHASRVVMMDMNARFGSAPYRVMKEEFQDGGAREPTFFEQRTPLRLDYLFWDYDAGGKRPDGIFGHPEVSKPFGSDHRFVTAKVYLRGNQMKRVWLLLASLVATAALGCSGEADAEDIDDDEEDVTASEAQELTLHNPIVRNCPDPSIMLHAGMYYLTCTGGDGDGGSFPIWASQHLFGGWTKIGAVFPKNKPRPTWATGDFWAPELHHVGDKLLVYYSAKNKANGKHAIGVAEATSLSEGFKDKGSPLLTADWSIIDAHEFDGVLYFKSENHNHISAVKLSPSGTSLAGKIDIILRVSQRWEGKTVEGPWVIKRGGWYYLFYSGNYYCNDKSPWAWRARGIPSATGRSTTAPSSTAETAGWAPATTRWSSARTASGTSSTTRSRRAKAPRGARSRRTTTTRATRS